MRLLLYLFITLSLSFSSILSAQDRPFITLKSGMSIESGAFVNPLEYNCYDTLWNAIIISGENYTLDFSGATLWGAADQIMPDQYSGIAIIIRNAKNIRLNNLRIHKFHTAIYIENSEGIHLNNCDLSYNFRPKLFSYREHEILSDWLSYHHNESRQWKNHGAAIYATNLKNSRFESLRITGGFNGILMDKCEGNKIYNSAIIFNSGVGVGLYKSSQNIIQHNRLDYNVRGVSHKFYRRGQDSAGVLLFEQCNNNTIAYNSITHSGDGIFLRAGQEPIEIGTGGSNGNILFENDCSYASTNGIEVTFSRNYILRNKLHGCTHGVQGGYSYESLIAGNQFQDNKAGIAIEHGQNNRIFNNTFSNNTIAIRLWANQPQDEVRWTAFNKNYPVQNEMYRIEMNTFDGDDKAIDLKNGKKFEIQYNVFKNISRVLSNEGVSKCKLKFSKNSIDLHSGKSLSSNQKRQNKWGDGIVFEYDSVSLLTPAKMDEGYDVSFQMYPWQGIPTIIMTEWGPYDFRYPYIHLADIVDSTYTFVIFGPAGSGWIIEQSKGFHSFNQKNGAYQDTLTVVRQMNTALMEITARHQGSFFFDQKGNLIPANDSFHFFFNRLEALEKWNTECYLLKDPVPSENMLQGNPGSQKPVKTYSDHRMHRDWWSLEYEDDGRMAKTNSFLSVCRGTIEIEPGNYYLQVYLSGRSRIYLNDIVLYDGSESDQNKPFLIPVKLQQNHNQIVIVNANKTGIASVHCRLLSR